MNQQLNQEQDPAQLEAKQQMVELSQRIADVCVGHTIQVVQGALGHLLAQLVMRHSENQEVTNKNIDLLARAMKHDVQTMVEHAKQHGTH